MLNHYILYIYAKCIWSLYEGVFECVGELGKPVEIDRSKLSPEEQKKFDEGWKNNAFNQYVSDMISVHRSLADMRDPLYEQQNSWKLEYY